MTAAQSVNLRATARNSAHRTAGNTCLIILARRFGQTIRRRARNRVLHVAVFIFLVSASISAKLALHGGSRSNSGCARQFARLIARADLRVILRADLDVSSVQTLTSKLSRGTSVPSFAIVLSSFLAV